MILSGDCLVVLPTLEADSVDACVTDPPYGLGFMAKDWDVPGGIGDFPMRRTVSQDAVNTGNSRQGGRQRSCEGFQKRQARDARKYQADCERWAIEVFRVLKPGAHLLVFGGTRTFHRMTCAVEDAGFEIRDCLSWLYGQGFPKSLDVAQAIDRQSGLVRDRVSHPRGKGFGDGVADTYAQDSWTTENAGTRSDKRPRSKAAAAWQGWGTALKPAWEPIVLARKPTRGTVAANVQQFGTGAINVDACRIPSGPEHAENCARFVGLSSNRNGNCYSEWAGKREDSHSDLGRWPANVCLDEDAAAVLNEVAPVTGAVGPKDDRGRRHGFADGRASLRDDNWGEPRDSLSGASRFLYVAKPSREERDLGCGGIAPRPRDDGRKEGNPGGDNPRNRGLQPRGNFHPTVKPLALMRWLVRLVTPPGGLVLDPFMGSGTTGMACAAENVRFIGIEREPEYVEIAERRIASIAPLFTESTNGEATP
jgi:DNA modification methylase